MNVGEHVEGTLKIFDNYQTRQSQDNDIFLYPPKIKLSTGRKQKNPTHHHFQVYILVTGRHKHYQTS